MINCKLCQKPFREFKRNGILMSKFCPDCRKAKEQAKKEKHKQTKGYQKSEYKKLSKKAWSLFSFHIRNKHANWKGEVRCYTCGAVNTVNEMQAGHCFHKGNGRFKALDFDENHIRCQCIRCNVMMRGRGPEFTLKLINEIGIIEVNRMRKRRTSELPLTAEELKEIIKKYE